MIPTLAVVSTAPFFLRPSSTTPRCGNTQSPKQALRESTGADHHGQGLSEAHSVIWYEECAHAGLTPYARALGMCSPLVQYEHLAHKNKSIPTSPHHRWVTYLVPVVLRAGLWVRPVEPSHQANRRGGWRITGQKYGQALRKFHNGEYFLPALTPALEGRGHLVHAH